jgi:hypothetical protein
MGADSRMNALAAIDLPIYLDLLLGRGSLPFHNLVPIVWHQTVSQGGSIWRGHLSALIVDEIREVVNSNIANFQRDSDNI